MSSPRSTTRSVGSSRRGKPAGVFATTPELVERWTALGATFVAVGVDIPLLAKAATDLAARYRSP